MVVPRIKPTAAIGSIRRENNFDFIRLFLAVLVIFSHSFPLGLGLQAERHHEPLLRLTGGQTTLGTVAVRLFFVISGFLITESYLKSRSLGSYFKKRFARIYPGFVVTMTLCFFVVAPLASNHTDSRTTVARISNFLLSTARLTAFHPPGIFATNPCPDVVNGSVWSISYEFWCYIGVAMLGVCGLLLRRGVVLSLFALSLLASVWFRIRAFDPQTGQEKFIPGGTWASLLPYYLVGMVFCLYRQYIPMRWPLALGSIGVLASGCLVYWGWSLAFPIAGAYLTFWLAFHPAIRLHGFARYGDFSYGTYLYAFPIQQLIVRALGKPTMQPMLLFASAVPCTLIAGVLSWHLVEKHFMVTRPSPRDLGPARRRVSFSAFFGRAARSAMAFNAVDRESVGIAELRSSYSSQMTTRE